MTDCCPSPEFPVILPQAENLRHRKQLRYLFYGQIFIIFGKTLTMGVLSGILQLITLWILYTSWATMHYCSLMFFMFSTGIDLLIMLMQVNAIIALFQTNVAMATLFMMMLIYYVVAEYVAYKAYSCFKKCYDEQHGIQRHGYSPFTNGMAQYDDERGARYGAGHAGSNLSHGGA